MIKNVIYYTTFFGIGGMMMLLLCVDFGQGTPACLQPRKLQASGSGKSKPVEVLRKVAQKQPKKAKPKKKALKKDDTKYKKMLEKSKIRIKRLEQRLARLSEKSEKLMQAMSQQLTEQRSATEKAQQSATEAQKQAQQQLAEAQKTSLAAQQALLAKFEAERKQQQTALHQQAQAQQAQRKQDQAKAQARQKILEAAIGRQASQLAAQRARQKADEDRRRKAQTRLNQRLAEQSRELKSERDKRQALAMELGRQTRKAQQQRRVDRQKMVQALAMHKRRMSELARKPRRATPKHTSKLKVKNWEQYLDFLAPVQSIKMDKDGKSLPVLDFNGATFADNLNSIMKFYQMGFYGMLIYKARNEKDPNYLAIDLSRGPSQPRFVHKTDPTEVDNLASIGLLWNASSIGRQLMAKIQAEQPLRIPQGAFLALVNLFPRSTAQYFIWKRIEVCRRNGIDPAQVNRCLGSFRQTSFGTWIVVIHKLEMKDGRMVSVDDFEESRVVLRRG